MELKDLQRGNEIRQKIHVLKEDKKALRSLLRNVEDDDDFNSDSGMFKVILTPKYHREYDDLKKINLDKSVVLGQLSDEIDEINKKIEKLESDFFNIGRAVV